MRLKILQEPKTKEMKNKVEFPIILSDRTQEFEEILSDFNRIVIQSAKKTIEVYNSMSLDVPFSTEIWKSLIINGVSTLEGLVAAKNQSTADKLGMSLSEVKKLNIISSKVSEINKVQMILWSVTDSFYRPTNSRLHNYLTLQDLVVLENGELDIDEKAKQAVKDKLVIVIDNPEDLEAFNLIKSFKEHYNSFIDLLDSKGYLPYVDNLSNSHLGNFFDTTEDLRLNVRPESVLFFKQLQ